MLKHPADGVFRYRVQLVSERGETFDRDFNCRWSPEKIDAVEIGQACAATESYLAKTKLIPTTCVRVA